jgi:hypothetical protein
MNADVFSEIGRCDEDARAESKVWPSVVSG